MPAGGGAGPSVPRLGSNVSAPDCLPRTRKRGKRDPLGRARWRLPSWTLAVGCGDECGLHPAEDTQAPPSSEMSGPEISQQKLGWEPPLIPAQVFTGSR